MDGAFAVAMAAVLGLIVGSFLNVCIHRLPLRQSVVWPGSRCPSCSHALPWSDNIPVVSWLLLRGRCRHCAARISIRYPVVEIATAAVAVLIVIMTPPGALLVSRFVFGSALIVLFMIDLEHQILPNVITLPGIAAGLVFSLIAPPGPANAVLGVLLGGGVLYAIAAGYYLLRKEEGMGMGDVKMLAMIGAFLGGPAVILTLILSSLAGAVIGLGMILFMRADMRYALPFGTFLAIAGFIAMLWGDSIIDWYAAQL